MPVVFCCRQPCILFALVWWLCIHFYASRSDTARILIAINAEVKWMQHHITSWCCMHSHCYIISRKIEIWRSFWFCVWKRRKNRLFFASGFCVESSTYRSNSCLIWVFYHYSLCPFGGNYFLLCIQCVLFLCFSRQNINIVYKLNNILNCSGFCSSFYSYSLIFLFLHISYFICFHLIHLIHLLMHANNLFSTGLVYLFSSVFIFNSLLLVDKICNTPALFLV